MKHGFNGDILILFAKLINVQKWRMKLSHILVDLFVEVCYHNAEKLSTETVLAPDKPDVV